MNLDCHHEQLARACPMCECESMIATLEQENRQMRTRMERLEKDAARYEFVDEAPGWSVCRYIKGVGWSPVDDIAIDAAMAKGE